MNLDHLVVVSNRLPVVLEKKGDQLSALPGSGGLITALTPILKEHGGKWIGWPGEIENTEQPKVNPLLQDFEKQVGYKAVPTFLSKEEIDLFYNGFSNQVIWPLFHDLIAPCRFDPKFWEGYQTVNQHFADTIVANASPQDFIWIHDYHLMLIAKKLREKGLSNTLSFFLHIPFPPLDIFLKLPWRLQIISALLEFDYLGFQTSRDQRNFIACARKLVKDLVVKNMKGFHLCKLGQRNISVGAYPISIDYKEFAQQAASKEVAELSWIIHEKMANQKIIFSIDRLDYTKGIPYRLEAIKNLLQEHPELHQKIAFVQVIIPSRTDIPEYAGLKAEIDQLVGEINSKFTVNGWIPIQYMFRSLNKTELLAYYRTSEIALITPVKDGMNLVAKEYVAANIEENGVLILSEFAGTSFQLFENALTVNPFDVEGITKAIYTAWMMPPEERKMHMRKMRRAVRKYDIFWWVEAVLRSLHTH